MSNLVSLPIPPEVVSQVLSLQKQIADLTKPYLVPVTPDERRSIPKMSDKTVAFVTKALSYAISNPQFGPQFLNVKELQNDVDMVSSLHEMETAVLVLESLLHDTIIAAGSDAYIAALSYYASVQTAAKNNVPGAQAIVDELKIRFEQSKKGAPLK